MDIDEPIDEKKVEEPSSDTSQKNAEEKVEAYKVEDPKPEEKVEGPDYEAKLKELTGAVKEKNKEILKLKDKVNDSQNSDSETTELTEQIEALQLEVQGLKEGGQEGGSDALKAVEEMKTNLAIEKYTTNPEKAKIVKHFLDEKVNPNLSHEERIQQAVDLTNAEFARDDRFAAEVEKANDDSVKTSSSDKPKGSGWSDQANSFADTVLQTDKGKAHFQEIGKNR